MSKITIVHSGQQIATARWLRDHLTPFGHEIADPQETAAAGLNWSDSILAAIVSSDIIVAIVDDRLDAVLFELGYAFGQQKPVILVSVTEVSLPSVLQNVIWLRLNKLDDGSAVQIAGAIQLVVEKQTARIRLRSQPGWESSLATLDHVQFEKWITEWFASHGAKLVIENKEEKAEGRGFDLLMTDPKTDRRYIVEAKSLSANNLVSIDTIRQLNSLVRDAEADAGIIITTSDYTRSAQEFARQSRIPLFLWSTTGLAKWYLPSRAIVQVRSGNILEGSVDLVVLPCSAKGTVSRWTQRHQETFGLPPPPSKMELGDVIMHPFPGPSSIARFFAYGASVRDTSSPEAIESIGRKIGEITSQNPSIRIVETPLLGSGSGGLEGTTSALALRRGFESSASTGATLLIYVAYQELEDKIAELFANAPDR